MRVVAKKTELKCKLCSHADRGWIDDLLLKRSQRGKDADGVSVNLPYVLEKLAELGVANPTEDNVKGHWKNHCEVISEEVAAEQETRRKEIVKRADGEPVDVDAVLDKIITLGESDLDTRVELTGSSGVTVDQMLKAAQVKSQRRTDEATRQLLGVSAAAIAGAFSGPALPPPAPELEAEVIEEAELVGG